MRRFLLSLTVITLLGWSQPAQQQAQPPIVLQVQMPPTNTAVHFLDLIVPGLVGAGIAFLSVWWTNRRNAAENAANRQHQLELEIRKAEIAAEYRSQDNRWAFRNDVYTKLIRLTHDILKSFHTFAHAAKLKTSLDGPSDHLARIEIEAESPKYRASIRKFTTYAALAPLATADSVIPLVTAVSKQAFKNINFESPDAATEIEEQMKPLFALLEQLQSAGRKDLWGTPGPGATA